MHLLEANPDKISWHILSANPNAIHLLEANPDKINWHILLQNPNAIHLLENNLDKIKNNNISIAINDMGYPLKLSFKGCLEQLCGNPSIFTYDYPKLMERMRPIAEEIMANRFHPTNAELWTGWGFDEYKEVCEEAEC
jgi:hypothetical protein